MANDGMISCLVLFHYLTEIKIDNKIDVEVVLLFCIIV